MFSYKSNNVGKKTQNGTNSTSHNSRQCFNSLSSKSFEVKDFEIKYLGEDHYFCIQSDTLLLADVFNNFGKMSLGIYGSDPAHFLSAPELAWQPTLKKAKVKLDLLRYIDMLLVVEKVIRWSMLCYIDMRKLIIDTLKTMIKKKIFLTIRT